MFEAEAKKRQQAAGAMYGENHPKQEVQEIVPEPLKPEPQARDLAASAVGVSGKYVSDIKAIGVVR